MKKEELMYTRGTLVEWGITELLRTCDRNWDEVWGEVSLSVQLAHPGVQQAVPLCFGHSVT